MEEARPFQGPQKGQRRQRAEGTGANTAQDCEQAHSISAAVATAVERGWSRTPEPARDFPRRGPLPGFPFPTKPTCTDSNTHLLPELSPSPAKPQERLR